MKKLLLAVILFTVPLSGIGATILVLGDSISAGYGIPREAGWVALLERHLARQYTAEFQVVNASISGETTAGGRFRLPSLLEQHDPELVIIALGGNDGLRGLSLDQMEENLRTMVAASRQRGSEVMLLSVELPVSYGARFNRLFAGVFEDIGAQPGVRHVAMGFDDLKDRDLLQQDGIHPTVEAQPILFDRIWATIEPAIDKINTDSGRTKENP